MNNGFVVFCAKAEAKIIKSQFLRCGLVPGVKSTSTPTAARLLILLIRLSFFLVLHSTQFGSYMYIYCCLHIIALLSLDSHMPARNESRQRFFAPRMCMYNAFRLCGKNTQPPPFICLAVPRNLINIFFLLCFHFFWFVVAFPQCCLVLYYLQSEKEARASQEEHNTTHYLFSLFR